MQVSERTATSARDALPKRLAERCRAQASYECCTTVRQHEAQHATNDGRLERQYDDGGSAAFDVCKRICGWATKRVGSARLTASHVADAG